jgi:hypothetical protein
VVFTDVVPVQPHLPALFYLLKGVGRDAERWRFLAWPGAVYLLALPVILADPA